MSGGFFRGTSADQDTRFSNKQSKLLKSQKFAPELDHLVDITKVKMDVIRPWIATRATELLGFEDEVLINFVYGLLDGKAVDGKKIQIQLTGFMEKNTGKFMRELWALLLSAQNNATGIPQQFLDAKELEIKNKKEENERLAHEMQRTKEKGRLLEEERSKRMDEEHAKAGNVDSGVGPRNSAPRTSSNDSREERDAEARNGRSSKSRDRRQSRSVSLSSKSVSRSPSPKKRYSSTKQSLSPARDSISPHRKYSSRDTSPSRRRSPFTRRSPISRRRSPSPHRKRSPYLRRRSPVVRHKSPSPLSRRSPPVHRRSPRLHHRSPSPARRRSPPARRRSPPPRRRSPHMSLSPVRRRSPSPVRRRSPSPVRRRSPSPVRRRSPPLRRRSPVRRRSPPSRHRSPSPSRRRSPPSRRRSPPSRRRSPSPLRLRSPPLRSMRRRSPSPLGRRSPSPLGRRSPSPMRNSSPSLVRQRSYQSNKSSPSQDRLPTRLRSSSPVRHRSQSPLSASPVRRSPSHKNKSPLYSQKMHGADSQSSPNQRKRNRSLSRSSSPPYRQPIHSDHDATPKTNGFDAKRHRDKNTPERIYDRSPGPQQKASYPSPKLSHNVSRSPIHHSRYNTDDKGHSQLDKAPASSNLRIDLQKESTRDNRARSFSGSPVRQSGRKKSHGVEQVTPDRKDTYRRDDPSARSKDPRLDIKNQTSYAVDCSPEVHSPDGSAVKLDYARKDLHLRGRENEQNSHKALVGNHAMTPNTKSLEVEYGPGRARDKHSGKDDISAEPDSARRSKRKNEEGSKVDSSGSDSEDIGAHKHHGKERRSKKHDKHKRESDYSSESDSDIEDRKEAKKRRKEERKMQKEEKRRRREERHRKRLERRAHKKSKSTDTTTSPKEHDEDNDDPKSEGYVSKGLHSADFDADSEQKRLEIELREKALETLRAKKRGPF